jgi:predicted nucleic acid-binding Zn ribbon protein
VTCRYCGTALPEGALFCGECGQPVAAAAPDVVAASTSIIVPTARSVRAAEPAEPIRPAAGFSIADLAFSSPGETSQPDDDQRDLPDGSPVDGDDGSATTHCPQCGEPMARGDVFCGECGFVVRTVTPPAGINLITLGEFPADPEAPGSDAVGPDGGADADATTEVERLSSEDDAEDDDAEGDDAEDDDAEDDDADDDDDADGADDPASGIDSLVVESTPAARAEEGDDDPDLEFDDPLPFAQPQVAPPAQGSPRSRPIPDPFPWGSEQPLREDLEATRLVADSGAGTRYVLQFSTGESVTVAGSGLIGRNPSMQPGEYVDQLVPIFDAGKSVSKTHLEFGQEAGRFWVSDRYSTNGSVIRQPDAEPRRCDAGRRYFIARGTRVDVGEQFFVVS